jgi:hypothetical protein
MGFKVMQGRVWEPGFCALLQYFCHPGYLAGFFTGNDLDDIILEVFAWDVCFPGRGARRELAGDPLA